MSVEVEVQGQEKANVANDENIAVADPVADQGAIGRWLQFESPAMEAAYGESALPGDLGRSRFLLWLTAFGAIIFVSQDYQTFGLSFGFYVGVAIRASVVAYCWGMLWRLRRPTTPRQLEGWMIALTVLLAFLVLFGYGSRPLLRMGHGLIALTVFALGLAVPMRFLYQTVAALAFALASMTILLFKNPDPFIAYGTFFVTTLSAALSLITSASAHRAQRERFAAHENEVQLRQGLESAMAEIKTLRGLLPICAACKKIRQGDGVWQAIESYLQKHTHARFTHGICPDCRERLYPETLPE